MIMKQDEKKIYDFIKTHWKDSIRHQVEDTGTLIGLPFPYTVPCPEGKEMQNNFYWDTYFMNVGLIRQGFIGQAKNNTDNLLSEVEKYGYVPNGNRTFFLNRTHPPLLCLMIRDVFDATQDREWLKKAFTVWEKEYDFWMKNRTTATIPCV